MTEPTPSAQDSSPSGAAPQTPFHRSSLLQTAALLTWALIWMAAQSSLEARGVAPRQQVVAFLGGALGVYGGCLMLARDWTLRLLTSVHFAVVQTLTMAAAVLAGTVVLQELTTEQYLEQYGPLSRKLIYLTHAQDLYRSLWFYALLSLLALSMLAVAWKKRPYGLPRLGFLLVHTAPTLVLLGGLWGKFSGVRAFNELRLQEPAGTFYRVKGAQILEDPYQLPGFQVRLDQFRVEQYEPEYKLYAFVEPDGKGGFEKNPKVYEVKPGLKGRLPLTDLRFEVDKAIPHALDSGDLRENAEVPEDPALRVMLGLGTPEPLVGTLFARGTRSFRQDEPGDRFALVYRDAWSPELAATLRPSPPKTEVLRLEFMGKTFDRELGTEGRWEFPAFSLAVTKFYPDFAVRRDKEGNPEPYSRSDKPLEPWVEMAFYAPDGSTRKLMLSARNPKFTDQLNGPNLPPGVKLRYVREGEERQSRFVVFTRQDQKIRLVESGAVVRTEPLELKKPFVVAPGLSVTPVMQLLHAEYVPDYTPHPDPKEATHFERPVVRVKVTDPKTGLTETHWLDAKGLEGRPESATFFKGRVGMIYQMKAAEPKDFKSVLTVLDAKGQVVRTREISVNAPLIHDGHWFYQSNYNPQDLSVSGIMMVYEPGLYVTYLGFGTLILGSLWMFYLGPWLQKRRDGGA